MKTQQESGTGFLGAILLIILIVILIFLTACTPSTEPKMLIKPSTPFDINNRSLDIRTSPYSIDCIHNVVCYKFYYQTTHVTCTYTNVRIKECEQQ